VQVREATVVTLPIVFSKNKRRWILVVGPGGIWLPGMSKLERTIMNATINSQGTCCDCGTKVDNYFGKCPRCRANRCSSCDATVGAQVVEFMTITGKLPPNDVEFCKTCYTATE
jgi:hypothetical protein